MKSVFIFVGNVIVSLFLCALELIAWILITGMTFGIVSTKTVFGRRR